MITEILHRRILSEKLTLQILRGAVSLFTAIVAVAGILTVANLELTPPQFVLGLGIVLSLTVQFCILWMLLGTNQKAA